MVIVEARIGVCVCVWWSLLHSTSSMIVVKSKPSNNNKQMATANLVR